MHAGGMQVRLGVPVPHGRAARPREGELEQVGPGLTDAGFRDLDTVWHGVTEAGDEARGGLPGLGGGCPVGDGFGGHEAAQERRRTGHPRVALAWAQPGSLQQLEQLLCRSRLVPARSLARRAEETAARSLPPVLLHHSRRTYRLGLALGVVTDIGVDEELLYAAAMLHDTGLLTSSGDADFTLTSTRVARDVAAQVGLPEDATTVVLDAITLHHSPCVGAEHGAVAQLLSAGAAIDVTGLGAWLLPDDVLVDDVTLHPREGFKDAFIEAFDKEAARVPAGRAAFLHRYGAFATAIRLAPFAE